MNDKQFLKDLYKKAEKYGIKITIVDSEYIKFADESINCGGYFDSEAKELKVAKGKSKAEYLGLLAHESSHMDQWIENAFIWDKLSHGYTIFFQWLEDKKIVKREILEEAVQDVIRLEKDCEVRAVKKIKKYNLPIDLKTYIRKANSYLFYYLHVFETRKWIPKVYAYKDVYLNAPSVFKKKYEKIPVRLKAALKRCSKQ